MSQNYQDIKDVTKRRVVLNLYESSRLKRVAVKLEVDFEAILKLQRKILAYTEKRVQNVLPLNIFDDYTSECLAIQEEILRRRVDKVKPITCIVTMKDEFDKRIQETGEVLDYEERYQMFIVEVDSKRYFMDRLCL